MRLSCTQRAEELTLTLLYEPHLYTQGAIATLAQQYQTVVDWAVRNPDTPISEVRLLGETERQMLLDLNHTHATYPNCCIHELFEAQVQRTPNAIAVVFADQSLTYRELDCRANQLAYYLQSQGIRPDTLVAICLMRSLDLVIGILGVLKAGGAYVPLDPVYPQHRLNDMLTDAQVGLLITQQDLQERFVEFEGTILCLDRDWGQVLAPLPVDRLDRTVAPENLAYTIYTSGSTGKPKGVMIAHRNLVNYLSGACGPTPSPRAVGLPSIRRLALMPPSLVSSPPC